MQRQISDSGFQTSIQLQQPTDIATLYQHQLSTPVNDYQAQMLIQYQQAQIAPTATQGLPMQANQRPQTPYQ